jgi:hypothetical protein
MRRGQFTEEQKTTVMTCLASGLAGRGISGTSLGQIQSGPEGLVRHTVRGDRARRLVFLRA